MADYRFSAQVIKRSSGRSATAAAAYRASNSIECDRTGLTHDYTRKGGTLHEEIMTPDNTPDWMGDRSQLWNAVEKVERRKDAQLAREVQLSLPHELTPEQRKELVREFVSDAFVSKGMIADIAIHAPNETGDQRNHHAHVMLTMRELTAEGFGKKNRDWNNPKELENWRELWANHQNHVLEHNGHKERVDHRSYVEQGIDKTPQQHKGTAANEMEKRGEKTRIGGENNNAESENIKLAKMLAQHAVLSAQIAAEKEKLNEWSNTKREEFDNSVNAKTQDREALQEKQFSRLEKILEKENGKQKAEIDREVDALNYKLSRSFGLRGLIRNITGQNKRDTASLNEFKKSFAAIERTEERRRDRLTSLHERQNERAENKNSTGRASIDTEILQRREELQANIDERFAEQRKPESLKGSFKPASTQSNENTSSRPQGRQEGRPQGRNAGRDSKPE